MHTNQFTQMAFVNYISAGLGNKVAAVSWAVQRDLQYLPTSSENRFIDCNASDLVLLH